MRLLLDHHYATAVAVLLRDRGHDVVAAAERGWEGEDDEPLLFHCVHEQRTLMTNNVADLAVIARNWASEGRSHFGLIFTSDKRMSRSRHSNGAYVTALDALLQSNPAAEAFIDRIHWLETE